MKNRKKGFTLIELLLVITIMGTIGVIATLSLNHTLQNANQRRCDDFVLEVEEAACVYSSLSDKEIICTRDNCPPITLDVLVREGHIKSEKDACTGEGIDLTKHVTVTWDDTGEKKCEYNGVKIYAK